MDALSSLHAFVHGGPQGPDDALLDFSVNTNPLGPNPDLVQVWRDAPLDGYPDPHYTRARRALAEYHGWDADGVVLGVGASELLHRIARAFMRAGDLACSLGAPFGEFARGVALQGGVLDVLPREGWSRRVPESVRLIYLSNPHNPTAHWIELCDLHAWPGILVVDEAYLPFAEQPVSLPMRPDLIRVLSPGKAHGVLGMRLAYALTTPLLARRLTALQPAWAIPASLAAVLERLPDQEPFIARTVPTVRAWARELAEALGAQPSGLHFFTVDVGDAGAVADALRGQGIRVRDCASFGHPNLVRIATRTPSDNRILIEAWRTLNLSPSGATSRS
ncbi:MAG: histidinol-phosphate aminotransferase family protein [Thermoflexales bacterium]|nr:histidinol-phosphate aminotransferase family protein [Thermoflexales bacterium]MDW8352368.1 histidinol-phosphate transaminase [Anaerolineae bacterium]